MSKKRILLCNEASYLATGFATYGGEVMRRLHATGKYELAEHACYAHYSDQRIQSLPWKVYSDVPNQNDTKGLDEYNAVATHQFGALRFEEIVLDFRPDIVFTIRDWWMDEFIERSPLRRMFHWALMPTVDSHPQNEQWIATYVSADGVFSYSDWGLQVLREQSGGSINTIASHPPGADINVFRPIVNKEKHKQKYGFNPNVMIIGTVMRNQKRKLIPDLFESFKEYLERTKNRNVLLYLHTSYPDVGWDIPRLLAEFGIGHKVMFTYVCRSCNVVFPALWQDARCICPRCRKTEAGLPNTQTGVSNHDLAEIINLFDVYVQYAIAEGFGMPQVEAASCGVPVMATDYSAMSDVVRKLHGMPIAVERMFRESETHCYRALPSNADFIAHLNKFFSLPEGVRRKKGFEAREAVEKYYTWDKTAKLWEDYFDSVSLKPVEQTWNSPPQLHNPITHIPANLSFEEVVRWGIINVLGDRSQLDSYLSTRLVRDLFYGIQSEPFGGAFINDASFLGIRPRYRKFTVEDALKELYGICAKRNYWEQRRVGIIQTPKPDYIMYAKPGVEL